MINLYNKYRPNERLNVKPNVWGGGEVDVDLDDREVQVVEWAWDSAPNRDLEELIILSDVLATDEWILSIPYMPYARQDRPENNNALYAISQVINNLSYTNLEIVDLHNISTVNYFRDARSISKAAIWRISNFQNKLDFYDFFIAPDAGAYKEVSKLGELFDKPVYCASKTRDSSGPKIKIDLEDAKGNGLVIDDICDGGRPFIELAKKLPEYALDLVVSHGLFTRGTEELWPYYNNVYSFEYNNAAITIKEN